MRVVAVDNDPDALELICIDLSLEGHDIVGWALDGVRGLELVAETEPDVLVVDHRMPPGPHGLEVARQVRSEHPAVKVIVYSNYQDVELVHAVRELGAHFLAKGNLGRLRRAIVAG